MPLVDKKRYDEMIHSAKSGKYAYPAINVTSFSTVNAVLCALEESKSDGIIQVSTGGGQFVSGQKVKSMSIGAEAIAQYVHQVADQYNVYVVLHTDHCIESHLNDFVLPLVEKTRQRRKENKPNLFSSHMFDGSTLTMEENIKKCEELLPIFNELDMLLEIEIGVVGGEEDGLEAKADAKLYTTNEDMLLVAERLGLGENGSYLLAATFGNVHGVYKPGHVKLNPAILAEGQKIVGQKYNKELPFDFVFHGGSGSTEAEIAETLQYGVVKMNVDTDAQYAYTRPIAHHMFTAYNEILKVDGEMGNKKKYDPRGYLKLAEKSMQARVVEACRQLQSKGKTIYKNISRAKV